MIASDYLLSAKVFIVKACSNQLIALQLATKGFAVMDGVFCRFK